MSDQSVHVKTQKGPVPTGFKCPLSQELMFDPVIVASGQTYERAYIQQWLDQGRTTCPKTGVTLTDMHLIPNHNVKRLIASWCKANNIPMPQAKEPRTHILENCEKRASTTNSNKTNDSESSSTTNRVLASNEHHVFEKKPLYLASEINEEDPEKLEDHIQTASYSSTSHSSFASTPYSSFTSSMDDGQSSSAACTVVSWGSDISEEQIASSSGAGSHDREIGLVTRGLERLGGSRQLSTSSKFMAGTPSSAAVVTIDYHSIYSRFQKLITDLESDILELQRLAAGELRMLAKSNPEDRIAIGNCGAIKPLISLLHSSDLKTQENAVTALLNLSLDEKNKIAIVDAGALEPLIHVQRTGNTEARENAATTLLSIAVNEETKVKIGRSGSIPLLSDLLKNGTPRGKKDAATALFRLSSCQENKVRIVTAGAVKPLIELMNPATGIVDRTVAALCNLSSIPEGCQAIGEEEGIPALVAAVELGSQRAKENAAAALLHLCSNSNKFRKMVVKEGAVPPLMALSKSGSTRGKDKALCLLHLLRDQKRPPRSRESPCR